MAIRIGTPLISPVRIQDDNIREPVAYVNELQGGAQSGPSIVDRDAVPIWLRQWGMFFTVYNNAGNNGTYVLTYGLVDADISNNANWKLFASGSGSSNVKKIDQSIQGSGSINIPVNSLLMIIMINAGAELPAAKIGFTLGNDDLVMTQDLPAGYNSFTKNIFLPNPTTIFFSGIDTQSTCSVIILQF